MTTPEPLKAITVRQPWASLIAFAATNPDAKLVENRGWPTRHRGPLAIHAGKTWDLDWVDDPEAVALKERIKNVLTTAGITKFAELPTGVVVAVADLVDCHRFVRTGAPFCCHPWGQVNADHFVLADVRALDEPVPARGQLGLWSLPVGVADVIREQLQAVAR